MRGPITVLGVGSDACDRLPGLDRISGVEVGDRRALQVAVQRPERPGGPLVLEDHRGAVVEPRVVVPNTLHVARQRRPYQRTRLLEEIDAEVDGAPFSRVAFAPGEGVRQVERARLQKTPDAGRARRSRLRRWVVPSLE